MTRSLELTAKYMPDDDPRVAVIVCGVCDQSFDLYEGGAPGLADALAPHVKGHIPPKAATDDER